MSAESPEDLIATFKNAALSVTKLYKTAVAIQAKTRNDGYQDCLDDLLAYLDKERIGLSEGEAGLIRRWAAERLEARDSGSQGMESEDEQDKSESDKTEATMSSPAMTRPSADALMREAISTTAPAAPTAPPPTTTTTTTTTTTQTATVLPQSSPQQPAAIHPSIATPAAAPTPRTTVVGHHEIVAPALDTFTFQSSLPFPYQDANLNMANLNLSDSHHHSRQGSSTTLASSRGQKGRNSGRSGSRAVGLGRGAGMKRKLNFAELFDLGGANNVFSSGGKRSRHA